MPLTEHQELTLGAVVKYRFHSIPAPPVDPYTTTGLGFVDLWVVRDIEVYQPGYVKVTFSASVELEDTGAPVGGFVGAEFQMVWGLTGSAGVVLPQSRFLEIDLAGAIDVDTVSNQIYLPNLIAVQAAGTYTLAVQWQGLSADSKADVFFGSASLEIEDKGAGG